LVFLAPMVLVCTVQSAQEGCQNNAVMSFEG